jgi:tetratricopeptide (TPR) repeat protein
LRAVSPIAKIVADVANANRTLLVDYPGLLEQRMRSTYRHSVLGEEFFLDHVHPTIEGHKLLGAELIEVMAGPGLVHPRHDWRNTVLPEVAKRIEGGVDPLKQGRALANLARVLLWAQKNDEAARLARQAMEVAGDIQEVADNAAASLATAYVRNGQPHVAVNLLYQYLARYPNSIELRLRLGQVLLDPRLNRREEAAANLLLIAQQMPYYDWGHALFGIDMAQRGRPRIAYPSLMEAVRLNPNNADAREELARVRSSLAGQELDPTPALIRVDRYPSSAPRRVLQGRINESGDFVPDGIEAEFHENGRVKRFVDIDRGKPSGPEMTWGADGTLLSQLAKP